MSDTETDWTTAWAREKKSMWKNTHISLFHILREWSGISDWWLFPLQPSSWILATVMVFQKYEFPRRPETTDNMEQSAEWQSVFQRRRNSLPMFPATSVFVSRSFIKEKHCRRKHCFSCTCQPGDVHLLGFSSWPEFKPKNLSIYTHILYLYWKMCVFLYIHNKQAQYII